MSTNITKNVVKNELSTEKEYENLALKYLGKFKKTLVDIIKNEYHYDQKTTEKIFDSVLDSVTFTLYNKYVFKEPLDIKNIYPHAKIFYKYNDFNHWFLVVSTIPLYQSLGDTLGYYNGNWEFNYGDPNIGPEYSNELIYQFISLGGINDISLTGWKASDDTLLYFATYKVLMKNFKTINDFGKELRLAYIELIPKLENRDPGERTIQSLKIQENIEWDKLPYDSTAIGAGSTMRSGCIGIFFPGKHNRQKLIALAIECSRITHNSTIAMLGSIVAALFTAYAIERIEINRWPYKILKLFRSDIIDNYLKESRPYEYHLYERDKVIYIGQWEKYTNMRFNGLNPKLEIPMLKNPVLRIDYFAKNFSKGHINNPGSTGDDSVIMAYDALLESGNVLEKLLVYSVLHPGDTDTVGSIAFSWFGALYHSPKNGRIVYDKFESLEFYEQIYDQTQSDVRRMLEIYYYDIYLNTALKQLKKLNK